MPRTRYELYDINMKFLEYGSDLFKTSSRGFSQVDPTVVPCQLGLPQPLQALSGHTMLPVLQFKRSTTM